MSHDALEADKAGEASLFPPSKDSGLPAAGEFDEDVDIPKLEELLKDYVFSQSIGTLNPPKFGKVLAAKMHRGSREHLCVLYTVESSGPADRPAYAAAIGDAQVFEEAAYVTDYMSISRAPPK